MKIKIYLLISTLLVVVSCGLDEYKPYDTPFVHVMYNNLSAVKVASNVFKTYEYKVYASTPRLDKDLVVTIEKKVGNGLIEGVDYEWITKDNILTFRPGIYDMPIRIKWLSNPLNPNKDNTIQIIIKSTNLGFNIGLPGPDHNQSVLTITKFNP